MLSKTGKFQTITHGAMWQCKTLPTGRCGRVSPDPWGDVSPTGRYGSAGRNPSKLHELL